MGSMMITQSEAIVLIRNLPGSNTRRIGDAAEFVPEEEFSVYDSLEKRGLSKSVLVQDEAGEECIVSTTTSAGMDSLRLYISGVGLRG